MGQYLIQSIQKHNPWIIFCLILFLPCLGYGFSATAQVDQTRIGPGEVVSLQVIVDGGQGKVDLSPISDFEILSSATQSSRSYINGSWTHQETYQYMLMPRKTGVLKIPELPVVRDGERTLTREIQILVSGAQVSGDEPPSFFARASLGHRDVVLGQQTVYTLKLYAAKAFSGASFDPPTFDGLMARELTQWKKYTQNIEGRSFMVNEIKYLVQGETIGAFDIAPAVFVARQPVAGSRKRRDPFDSFFNESLFNTTPTKPVRVVSNQVSLNVTPLPEYRGDAPFSGLVGVFTIGTSLDKPRIKTGESATLTITIQGQGNIMDAGVPVLDLPPGQFKVYADTPVEKIQATEEGVAGKKIFRQALVPSVPGDVTIPALTLTYFDVTARAYKRISTDPIRLQVIPGEPAVLADSGSGTSSSPDTAAVSGPKKEEVVMRNRDILDIRESISGISPDNQLSLPWFLILVFVPGLGFGCLNLVMAFKTREKTISEQYRAKAKDYLSAARKASPGSAEVLGLIQSAMTAAVLSLGNKKAESLTREEAKSILSRAGKDQERSHKILELMDALDAARFGGGKMDEKTSALCMSGIQGLLKIMVLAVCLSFAPALFPGSGHASDTAGVFIDGTRAYQAGDYQAAAEKFQAVARSGVKNSALFYNLGNAYLKSGDLGRAVLWYERASRLSPNDPDLKFNLAHARTRLKDKVDASFTPMDILFFWQGLISLKWLQYSAIGLSFLFFTWSGIRRVFNKKILSGPGLPLLVLLSALVLASGLEAYRLNADHRAVILGETVAVRSGTMETATPLFDLHAGTRVRVMEKKNHHLKIRFAKGKVGWVSMDEAEII